MDSRTKNLENQTFGRWTILRYAGIIKDNAHWHCRCSCGFEKTVKAQYLLNGTSTKCQTCAVLKRAHITNMVPDFYWRHVISNASKRNIELLVSKEQCYDFLVAQNYKCAISGLDICLSTNASDHLEGKTTASLDRIESSKPYQKDNVQWLHKDINMMKHVFTHEHFLFLCNAVVNHYGDQRSLADDSS